MEGKNEFESSKFVHPPDDDLVCAICLNVAQDAVETQCVHIFCEACISGWMNKSKTCPVDRQRISPKDVVPSRFARKKILNLMMKCECGKTHSVRDFENHKKECKNRKKKCEICNVFVKESLFEAHIADQLGKHHDALLQQNQRFKQEMKELRTEFEDQRKKAKELRTEFEYQRSKAKEAQKKFQSYRKKTDATMTSFHKKLDLLQKKVALQENESKSQNSSAKHEVDRPLTRKDFAPAASHSPHNKRHYPKRSWRCPQCNLENTTARSRCAQCGKPKPQFQMYGQQQYATPAQCDADPNGLFWNS